MAARSARIDLEALLRARKLDNTLTSALPAPGVFDERTVVPTGIAVLDERLHGGVPRGQMSEIVGPRSSGRTSLLVALLAGATARGEIAALVDTLDMFDAVSAAACGIDLGRLLWVRGTGCPGAGAPKVLGCQGANVPGAGAGALKGSQGGNVAERAIDGDHRQGIENRGAGLRSAVGDGGTGLSGTPTASGDGKPAPRVVHVGDARGRHPALAAGATTGAGAWERVVDRAVKALNLVLQAGGFGLVALDLAEVPPAVVRRLPFTTWLRLQRVIEGSETACVLLGAEPVARSAGGVTIALKSRGRQAPAPGTWRLAPGTLACGRHARLFLGLDVEAHLSRARWPETTPCRFQLGGSSQD